MSRYTEGFDYRWLDIYIDKEGLLTVRERAIIRGNVFSCRKIKHLAKQFDISKQRVVQVRNHALKKLEKEVKKSLILKVIEQEKLIEKYGLRKKGGRVGF